VDRKQQILEVAEDLLLVRGFSAFSYADISERLGIQKASIHHHFPTKEDLGVALLDRFIGMNQGLADECAGRDATALEMLDAFLERGAQLAAVGDRCCPAGVLQAEYNALPDRVRGKVDELSRWSHESVTRMLARGREAGEFRFEGEPSAQAWLVLSTLHGAMLNARVHGASVFEAVSRQLRAALCA
jgi:TetR/AcrR family transcriptional repressor of nem operon